MNRHKDVKTGNTELLLAKIHSQFPELQWSSYTYITEGWDHEVILLDNQIVFRFPLDEEYTESLKTEIEILHKLRSIVDIDIPNYKYIADDYSFAGYPIIGGSELTKSNFDSLDSEVRHNIAQQLADFLSAIHTAKTNGYDFNEVPVSYFSKDQQDVKDLAIEHLKKVLTPKEIEEVHSILAEVDAMRSSDIPKVFIHGDVYSRHLLWDSDNSKLGIIDFSDMSTDDPAIDFAELHEYGRDFVQLVYELYRGPKDSTFLDRSWQYQKWISVYMMTDHFVNKKTSFKIARQTFNRILKY